MRIPTRAGLPAVLAMAVVLTACGGGDPPPQAAPTTAPPTTTVAPTTTPAPTTSAAPAGPPTCNVEITVTADSTSVSGEGPGATSISSTEDGTMLTCENGPEVALRITGGNVFVTYQGKQTRARVGRPAEVGPYRIEVLSAEGRSARLRIVLR